MGSKLFELCSVVARLDFEQGEKVECLEYSVGCLYVGTSLGNLHQFGVVEKGAGQGDRFTTDHLSTKQVVANRSKISFLHAAPAINRLLVMADSSLHILNMTDLTSLPMAGSNKLRGLSAVCVQGGSDSDNPYSVEVCVAKSKGCQLALLTLTEDKLSVTKTRDTGKPVLSMAMSGSQVCAALSDMYVVYNLARGTMVDLFPRTEEGQITSSTVNIAENEFLVAGPGNLGIFVKADGSAGRPPIQWGHSFSGLLFREEGGLVLGLAEDLVVVYRVGKEGESACQVQTVSCPGARCLASCGGTLLVATSQGVQCLTQVPWQKQAEVLLESGHLKEADKLAEGVEGEKEDVDRVRQRAGFLALQTNQWDFAKDLLLRGNTDVREVLSIYPGMLGGKSRFVRSDPPLHTIPDINSLKVEDDDRQSPLIFLRNYLEDVVEKTIIVDTAMVKIVALVSPKEVERTLRDCTPDYHDLEDFFSSRQMHHFKALTLLASGRQEEALKMWSSMMTGQEDDINFPGLEFFCQQLSTCSAGVRFSHCDLVLQNNQMLAIKLFSRPGQSLSSDSETEYVDSVLNILTKYPGARLMFLQWLVMEQNSQVERHHTQLAMTYISRLKNIDQNLEEDIRGNFSKLILTSSQLKPSFLLSQLRDTDLEYEKAILHGKMGEHDKALDILVNKVKDTSQAEHYCDEISREDRGTRASLLGQLLNCYLNPLDNKDRDRYTVLAVDLINNRAEDLHGPQVLAVLPQQWNISIIMPALRKFSRSQVHHQRMTKVTKHLYRGENVQLRNKLISLTREPVVIQTNHYCVSCKKGFGGEGLVARYPNGVTLHADCIKDETVCPLTGTVFTVKR